MDDDSKEKEDDGELKGEVLLPEVDDEFMEEEEDVDPLLPRHPKKVIDEESDEVSLDALVDEEEEELPEDSYDDEDPNRW